MIAIRNLTVQAGLFRLANICLEAPTGQYLVLMGKTGSGKTTLLEAICGLRGIESGSIELLGRDVTHCRPAQRLIGYVPQDGALFPSMSVYDHLAFALRLRKLSTAEIDHRVRELAALLGIEHLLPRRPHGLSGGEAQRVALGRALAPRPGFLCLDEPLNALDRDTHHQMCDLLKRINLQSRITTLHVTHDPAEAGRLADRLLTLTPEGIQDGR